MKKDKEKKAPISMHRHKHRYKHVLPLAFVFVLLFIIALALMCPTASAGDYGYGCPKVTTEPYHNDFYHWYNGTIRGGIYFQINGSYSESAGATQTYLFHDVPDGRKIARYYYGVWLGSRSNKTVGASISTNGHITNYTFEDHTCPETYEPDGSTQDCPICQQVCVKENPENPDATADITGCGVSSVITNVTEYTHLVPGENTIVWYSSEQPYQFALMVLYENNSMPFNQYWIKEGHEYPVGPSYPFTLYFNETVNTGRIYPGSIQSVKLMTNGYPHCLGACEESGYPTLNGNELGAPDYIYSYDAAGAVHEGSPPGKKYTVFARWDNIPPDYITRPSNRIYYPTLKDNDRLIVPVLMLSYYEPSELNVTDVSPESLCVNWYNTIDAKIVNTGGTASFFNVTLYANGDVIDVKRVTNLGEGDNTTVKFLWKPSAIGPYVLNVTADVENVVNETDKTNNSKTLNVEVKVASPPEWQSQSSNVSSIPSGGTIELRAQGIADVGLEKAILCTNETGAETWENITDGRYGSPMNMASYYNYSLTHTTESDWKAQTLDNSSVVGEDVKLYRMLGTTNLALNQPASASASASGYPPSNAVDGTSNFWIGNYDTFPVWWYVNLGAVKEVQQIDIDFPDTWGEPYKYTVDISNNAADWTTKIEKSVGRDETFDNLEWSCQYIRVYIIEAYGTGWVYGGIEEFEAYGPGDYKSSGTLTSSEIGTDNPIVAVTPTWNSTEPSGTSISVKISIDSGATWKDASNGELTWDYDPLNNSLKYKVLFATTDITKTPVLHDISLNYRTKDPIESEWLWSNFTWQNASIPEGTTVGWKIYYEDMLGQTNCTAVKTFEVGAPGPVIELIREQANTTGVNQATTVRLIVWNTDSSENDITSLNLTEWVDSDWAVTDCGGCDENTSTYIKWTLGDLARDNYTMVSYKIKAPASSEISTFKANCTYKYDGKTGSEEGSEFLVSVQTGKAFFDFELDMNAVTPTIDRDVPEGTEKTVLYSVTNVGDAVPCDTVFIELKVNKTAWDVTCVYCDEFYTDTDYYYLKWNESSWAVQETKVFNFTVNSSHVRYYNFSSNGTYDPPASANAFIGQMQIYYPGLLLEEIGVGKDINGSDGHNASDVIPPTPIDDNSSLPPDDSATNETPAKANDSEQEHVNETIVTEIVEVTCNVQEQKQVLNIEAKLVYDVNETPIPNKEICFYRDTALIGSELTNGEGWAAVSCDTSELPVGNYTINVIYKGDETLSNAAQQIEITLVSPTPTPTPTSAPTTTTKNETANETQEPENITADLTPGPPIVTLISPTNTTYNNTEIELNYTVNEPVDWIAYSLNELDNVTITGEGNTTLNASIGLNTLTVYANDSFGNMGSASVPFVVNITNVTATAPEPENITVEITPVLVAMKEHFPLNEKPAFKFKFSVNAFSKRVGLKTLATPTETIETAVYYKDELVDIEPEIEELREGEFSIEIPSRRAFRAGLYTLKVELVKDNVTYVEEQDFTWGVLAINTHKSIYLPNETAFIGIAVLDDEGHMVCDAAITLTITDPDNKEAVLSTSNGLIKVSPECSVYGVTNLPDYYTNYEAGGAGTYVMDLTAVTPDGTKSITDEFSVQNSVDFDVARDGPTRIYPPVPYVMNFIIKANKNYTGLIKEYVPASFVITPQDGLTVTTVGDTKILTWNKNLAKGATYNIYYEFDAPDVSPYLFLLGRLQIGGFEEKKDWMIASDAPDTETLTPDSLIGIVDNLLTDVQSSNDYRIGVDRGDTGGVTFTDTSIPSGSTINSVIIYYEHWEEEGHTANSITIHVGTSTDASAFGSGTVTDNIGPNANTQGEAVATEDTDSFTCSPTPLLLSQLNDLQVEFFNDDGGGPDEMWIDYIYAVVDYTPSADTTPPTYTNDGDNSSGSVTEGAIVETHVYWTDADSNLGKAVLRTNKTGEWTNESWHTFAGNPEWANITFNTTGHAGKTICWAQWANDTSNNWNTSMSTTAHCFNVLHVTKIPQVLINDTNPNHGDSVKIEAKLEYDNGTAIADQNVSFYYDTSFINSDFTNSTGWATINWDTTGVPGGARIINATYAGNASIYTRASYNNTEEIELVSEKVWVTNIEVHFVRVKSAAAMDTTPPASITTLHNTTYAPTYINWSWANPEDADFSHVMVYIDGTLKENVLSPLDYYNATGFAANTQHTISTHTVDTSGNVNLSWVNHSAWTAPAPAGAPTVEIISITPDDDLSTSGVQINPVPNSVKTVTVTAQVSDSNGHEEISKVEITSITPNCSASPPPNINLDTKEVINPTTANYTGTFDMQFYDASITYMVTVTATDTGDLTGSNSSSFEYQTCIALELDTTSIAFGSVDPGSYKEVIGDTFFPNAAPTIKNSGNVVIDMRISGTEMSGSGTIPVDNIYDDLNNPDGYTALSNTPVEHDELNLTAGASSVHGIDFKLNVPSGTAAGGYSGTVTLEAKLDD